MGTDVTDKKQVLEGKVDKFRKSIETYLEEYIAGNYKKGKCTTAVYGSDSGVITVCISARNVHLSSFWTGNWRATYTLNTSEKETEMKGNIKVMVHYFEDGNVQLHTALDKTAKITIKSEDDTAKDVVKAIDTIETDFQSNLEEMYVNMPRTTFKAMRRVLPIICERMNWSSAAHQVA